MATHIEVESPRPKNLPTLLRMLRDIDPDWTDMFTTYVTDGMYGRNVLSTKQMELCAVQSLAVLDKQRELKNHMKEAFAAGASKEEIAEVVFLGSIHAGFPNTMSALRTFHELLTELGHLPAR